MINQFFRSLTYLRGLILVIWLIVHTGLTAIFVLVVMPFLPGKRNWGDWVIGKLWAKPVVDLCGIDVIVRGEENWPPHNRGCLVLFNHTSWMDIFILSACLPRVVRFGAKIELFQIPIFSQAMHRVGALPIERKNRTKVLQIYKESEVRIKNGECFALAPEGTRQTELQLGRFKQGPFLFAIGAQAPIVPVLLAGSRELMPKGSWLVNAGQWRRKVIVQILPSLSTENCQESDFERLQNSMRASMTPVYENLNRELGLL